jgi:ribonuclease E
MTMRMLIDARHREETRVAVVKGNRIEEFDFESAERKQLKGNIYLAKVTRVEPSLQAAFVDYGGNRHGFLAFSEIHPDYYQIPREDREALLREEAEHAAAEAALRGDVDDDEALDAHHDDDGQDHDRPDSDLEEDLDADSEEAETAGVAAGHDDHSAAEDLRRKRMALRRRYKIQDVIHRRQVLLVQVVKEERGNKGAALTTYLSLAGRYCVLMPNTTHGGGISRKISNVGDRKRLKSILADLALPSTMGCIVRTAGLQRTKTEIKRDFDYLARLWDGIRENTLKSSAPALIHEDSDLIRRAIRDIYNRDIDEVIVEGDDGYKHARDFMKLLMPSHVKKVRAYSDAVPLFQRYGAEDQLAAMYNPVVQLKSGGYLVINPTEALVSIDINSGRSTREHGIEATAVGTNLEAAQEIARQLRLRDMAGLVVIDFIDMEHNSNVRKVEKAMKAALANDRARIQVGRISSFGLMEMSRQRLRTGVLEASTRTCPHCEGTGLVRTASSAGLSALRMLEEEAAKGQGSRLVLRASQEAAFYVLNRKRAELAEIEARYGVFIDIISDGEVEGARMIVEASGPPPAFRPAYEVIVDDDDDDDLIDIPDDDDEEEEEEEEVKGRERSGARGDRSNEDREDGDGGRKRSRRRRGRRGGRREEGEGSETEATSDQGDEKASLEVEADGQPGDQDTPANDRDNIDDGQKRKRRGRRGGRRRRGGAREDGAVDAASDAADSATDTSEPVAEAQNDVVAAEGDTDATAVKKPRRRAAAKAAPADDAMTSTEPADAAVDAKPKRVRKAKAVAETPVAAEPVAPGPLETGPAEAEVSKPKRTRKKAEAIASDAAAAPVLTEAKPVKSAKAAPKKAAKAAVVDAADVADAPADGSRKGWWQRTFGPED